MVICKMDGIDPVSALVVGSIPHAKSGRIIPRLFREQFLESGVLDLIDDSKKKNRRCLVNSSRSQENRDNFNGDLQKRGIVETETGHPAAKRSHTSCKWFCDPFSKDITELLSSDTFSSNNGHQNQLSERQDNDYGEVHLTAHTSDMTNDNYQLGDHRHSSRSTSHSNRFSDLNHINSVRISPNPVLASDGEQTQELLNDMELICPNVPLGFEDETFVHSLPPTVRLNIVSYALAHQQQRQPQPIHVGTIRRAGAATEKPVNTNEIIISVDIFHPTRHSLQQEIIFLGDQTLADFRDVVFCWMSDLPLQKEVKQHSFFYISGAFYEDHESSASHHIVDWANQHGFHIQSISSMNKVKFKDLHFQLFAPYVFVHCATCEHRFFFSQLRIRNDHDLNDLSVYPSIVFQKRPKIRKCQVCLVFPATHAASGDYLAPEEPCLYCAQCLQESRRGGVQIEREVVIYKQDP